MSTRLTQKGTPMVESQSLNLVLSAERVNDVITKYVSTSLKNKGYKYSSPSTLSFLSTLECGVNYGSEIARNIGVSRQMVAKTIKELSIAGYLKQVDGVGKQKEISFTTLGELLMSDARNILADIDQRLNKQIGIDKVSDTIEHLMSIQGFVEHLNASVE